MNNILMILASVLLNAVAQLLIRKGMLMVGTVGVTNFAQNILPMLLNPWLWGAMLSYAVSILLWMSVLSKVEVSFARTDKPLGKAVARPALEIVDYRRAQAAENRVAQLIGIVGADTAQVASMDCNTLIFKRKSAFNLQLAARLEPAKAFPKVGKRR